MNVKSTLIFPPQFEPFQPYLSLPVLSSALKAKGYDVNTLDLNVDYFNRILRPSYLERFFHEFPNSKNSNSQNHFEGKQEKYILDNLGKAVHMIRDVESFKDLPTYKWAMNMLKTALELFSAKHTPSVVNFYESHCGTTNYDSRKILTSIAKDRINPFKEYINNVAIPRIMEFSPGFIGISLVVHDQLAFTLTLCQELKRLFPHIHICAGGALISRSYNRITTNPAISSLFDSLVIGEGEETICELVEAVEKNAKISDITGVLIPSKIAKFRKRKPTEFVEGIFPDFSELPIDKYFSPILVLPYLTSYGCHWGKCSFCCHHFPYGRYREKSEKLVVEQLAQLSEQYGTNYFNFTDEQITPERLNIFAEKFIEHNLDIEWFTFARMEKDFKEPEFCNQLYRAGCRTLMFGFESAVQRILDMMHKGTEVADFPEILSACKSESLSVRLDTMVGFPTESEEESDCTLDFLCTHKDLIDTPFSITPLSTFELQKHSRILENAETYGISPIGPLRGDLDYEVDYEIQSGMNRSKRLKAFEKFVTALNSQFESPRICPENKSHAFLMKCFYDEGLVSTDSFQAVVESPYLYIPVLYPGVQVQHRDSIGERGDIYLLSNLLSGMQLEIDHFCKDALVLAGEGHSIGEIFAIIERQNALLNNNSEASFKKFLTFLWFNDFISFASCDSLENQTPQCKILTVRSVLSCR